MVAWLKPLTCVAFSSIRATTQLPNVSVVARSMASSEGAAEQFSKPIVQYIFVRRDLDWPTGAVAAQVAHASVAAIVEGKDDAATIQYTTDLLSMTKMVYGVDSKEELESIKEKWETKYGGTFHLWMEQPENTPTALATWPVERTNAVSKLVKNLKVSFL